MVTADQVKLIYLKLINVTLQLRDMNRSRSSIYNEMFFFVSALKSVLQEIIG